MDNDPPEDTIFKQVGIETTKPARKKYPTRKVIANASNDIWAADLVQMTTFSTMNDGYSYILTIIDVFTRYAWAVPLQSKKAEDVLDAFKKAVAQNDNITPKHIWVDEGKEFYNKDFKAWCKSKHITLYSSHGTHKAAVVERFNRTLKTMMWADIVAKNTRKWYPLLDDYIRTYNHKTHSSIKMTPYEAKHLDKDGLLELWNMQYGNLPSKNKAPPKFKVGDYVRMSRRKEIFEKGYEQSWTMEIFKIVKALPTIPYTYQLEDLLHEKIIGSYYEPELQHTIQTPDGKFLAQETLQKRVVNGKPQELIKWLGYSNKFNSWIDAPADNTSTPTTLEGETPAKPKPKPKPAPPPPPSPPPKPAISARTLRAMRRQEEPAQPTKPGARSNRRQVG
jgi:hypothetical protein